MEKDIIDELDKKEKRLIKRVAIVIFGSIGTVALILLIVNNLKL